MAPRHDSPRPLKHRGPALVLSILLGVLGLVSSLFPSAAAAAAPLSRPVPGALPTPVAGVVGALSFAKRDTMLAVSWQDVPGAAGYLVHYSTKKSLAKAVEVATAISITTITGLQPKTTYYLRVTPVDAAGTAGSPGQTTSVTTAATEAIDMSMPLVVGSFNVLNANRYNGWAGRRQAVADTISGEEPAVVGLQEATFKRVFQGRSQYQDVVHLLGEKWRATDSGSSMQSEGTRVIYDTTKVKLGDHGYLRLPDSRSGHSWRYAVWAVFTQRDSGDRFLFVTTHLTNGRSRRGNAQRGAQARAIVALASAKADGLPVVITGDFNSNKFTRPTNVPYDVITGAGYLDPLGNTEGNRSAAPLGIAESRIRADLNSYNGFAKRAPRLGSATGVTVDQIFVSPGVEVREWETVAKLDASGNYVGAIPSDHNMVRATLLLS